MITLMAACDACCELFEIKVKNIALVSLFIPQLYDLLLSYISATVASGLKMPKKKLFVKLVVFFLFRYNIVIYNSAVEFASLDVTKSTATSVAMVVALPRFGFGLAIAPERSKVLHKRNFNEIILIHIYLQKLKESIMNCACVR